MSQPTAITERALVYLHPDDDITDSSSKAGKIFENLLATISNQQGFVAGHWGRRLGDENIAEHIVDWDSIASHDAVNNDPTIIDPIIEDLNPIMRADPDWYHVNYTIPSSHEPTTLSTLLRPTPAVTQLTLIFLDSDASAQALETAAVDFVEKEVKRSAGYVCAGWGWVVESLDVKGVAKQGGEVKAFNLAIGWDSVGAAKSFNDNSGSGNLREALKGLVSGSQTDLLVLKRQ